VVYSAFVIEEWTTVGRIASEERFETEGLVEAMANCLGRF
jgi:hypothetical protein